VGSKNSFCDYSFILGYHIVRSVNLKADFNSSPPATWLASGAYRKTGIKDTTRTDALFITGLSTSMAVNTLVTGMIVFRILKVSAGVKPTSVERTLGSTKGTKFWHILFVIIESGMALFAIQVVRVVLMSIALALAVPVGPYYTSANDFVVVINQMLNVIIINSVHFYFCFSNNIYLTRASHRR
jgi:hypothetical protein